MYCLQRLNDYAGNEHTTTTTTTTPTTITTTIITTAATTTTTITTTADTHGEDETRRYLIDESDKYEGCAGS